MIPSEICLHFLCMKIMGNHCYIFAHCHDLNQNPSTIYSGNNRLAQRWEVVGQVKHVCIMCSSKIKGLAKYKVTFPHPQLFSNERNQ